MINQSIINKHYTPPCQVMQSGNSILTLSPACGTLLIMTEHTKIDLGQLVRELHIMNSRKQIYRVIKRELRAQGHWKDRGQGNPVKGFKAMRGDR